MKNLFFLETLSHRSRDRIKDLGEVFTPETYVEDMLNLLAKDKRGFWSDEENVFFEPCSGHGNIVIPIYKRRLDGFYKKAITQGLYCRSEAPFYAVANALNTLWAIDIDPRNVENCRSRVLLATLNFLKTKLEIKSNTILFTKKRDFISHVLSAIKWHIHENETLSAISIPKNAKVSANLTKAGAKWFSQNGHSEFDFELTWVKFFESCEQGNTIPLEYQRSLKFVDAIIAQRFNGFDDFSYAKVIVNNIQTSTSLETNTAIGA